MVKTVPAMTRLRMLLADDQAVAQQEGMSVFLSRLVQHVQRLQPDCAQPVPGQSVFTKVSYLLLCTCIV